MHRSTYRQLGRLLLLGLVLLSATPRSAAAADWIYTVQPGDTLWSFCRTHLGDMNHVVQLETINQIRDPLHIPPGTRLRVPLSWLRKTPAQAMVLSLHGTVERRPTDKDVQVVSAGDALDAGDEIRTGPDSNVRIGFQDGSQLLLLQASRLLLEELQVFGTTGMVETKLRLLDGRVENLVQPATGPGSRFEIITPAAVAAVRGTEYRVGSGTDGTTAEVLGGSVGVTGTGGGVAINQGFGTAVSPGEAPLPPVPLLPPPDISALPSRLERTPVELHLPRQEGIRCYRLQIAKDRDFKLLISDSLQKSSRLHGPDLPNGDYVARIRAVDPHGLEGRDAIHPFTMHAYPEPPSAIFPAPNARVTDERPLFTWTRNEAAVAYHFQLADSADFTAPILDLPSLGDTRCQPDESLPPGNYVWRLAAIDAQGTIGPWSDAFAFSRPKPGPAGEIGQTEGRDITITWRAGEPGESYQVQISRERNFTTPFVDTQTDAHNLSLPRPEPGTYYLRVRTIAPDGSAGPYGTVQTIDVPATHWWTVIFLLLPLVM